MQLLRDREASSLRRNFDVGQTGARNAILAPAMNRRNRGKRKLVHGARSAKPVDDLIGDSVHGPDSAIIATSMQGLYCDNRYSYVRGYGFEESMDVAAIRKLMDERGETGAGLARLLGISPDKFSKSMSGKRRFTVSEVDVLRRYFGVLEPEQTQRRLPIVGLVSAGAWREGFEQVIGWMPNPDNSLSDQAFVVVVSGDSMDQIANDGDQIVVEPRDRTLINNKLYVIRNHEGETTFKRYRENPARLEPCSNNPSHETIYPGQEGFEVIGRVKKLISDLD